MPQSEAIGVVRSVIEWASLGIEVLGALIIIVGVIQVVIAHGTVRFLLMRERPAAFESYKHQLGRTLLLGLELLVAGDVVRTVALEPTLNNVSVLGVLVVIRTFLSWSLFVEIEGRWPWQPKRDRTTPIESDSK